MIWQKVPTDPSKKYYFTIQNISVIPNSYVYIKIKDRDEVPTDDNGAITLTSKNLLTSVLPTNSYMYLATSDGGIIGSVVNEVINNTNFKIETVHEDIELTTGNKKIVVPTGGLLVLQNLKDDIVYFNIGKKEGKGVLEKHQIFAISFAKETEVRVTGSSSSKFSYVITSSVNMTTLDKKISDKIDYVLSNLNIFMDKYITKEALEQVANMIGRGEFTNNINISNVNSNEVGSNNYISLIPIGNLKVTDFDNSVIEVIGDIKLTRTGQVQAFCESAFSFIVDNGSKNEFKDLFLSNNEMYEYFDKVITYTSNTKDGIYIKYRFDSNYKVEINYKVRISSLRYEVKNITTPFNNTNSSVKEYTVIADITKHLTTNELPTIHNALVENVKDEEISINGVEYKSNGSSANKIILTKGGNNVCVIEFNETTGYVNLTLNKPAIGKDIKPTSIYKIVLHGFKRGQTFLIPLFFFSDENSTVDKTVQGNEVIFKVKLHAFKSVNKEYHYYKEYFRKLYNNMEQYKVTPNIIDMSNLKISYVE